MEPPPAAPRGRGRGAARGRGGGGGPPNRPPPSSPGGSSAPPLPSASPPTSNEAILLLHPAPPEAPPPPPPSKPAPGRRPLPHPSASTGSLPRPTQEFRSSSNSLRLDQSASTTGSSRSKSTEAVPPRSAAPPPPTTSAPGSPDIRFVESSSSLSSSFSPAPAKRPARPPARTKANVSSSPSVAPILPHGPAGSRSGLRLDLSSKSDPPTSPSSSSSPSPSSSPSFVSPPTSAPPPPPSPVTAPTSGAAAASTSARRTTLHRDVSLPAISLSSSPSASGSSPSSPAPSPVISSNGLAADSLTTSLDAGAISPRGAAIRSRAPSVPQRTSASAFFTPISSAPFTEPVKRYNIHIRTWIEGISSTKVRLSMLQRLFPSIASNAGWYSPMKIVSISPGGLLAVKPKKPGRPTSVNIKRLSMPRPTSRAFKFHDLPFFDEEDEDTDELILTNENGVTIVKAGTVDKLIARLTYEKHPDPSYLSAFLLTYQSFTTPGYLLDKLIERFNIQPPPGSSAEYVELFIKKKKTPVQARTCNAIKTWLERNWKDLKNDMVTIKRLLQWVKGALRNTPSFESVSYNLERLISNNITGMKSKSVLTRGEPVPPALLPRSNRFVEWEPLEIARQLALLEFTNYQAIQPKECQNQSWNGEHRDELAPNISKMITRSNDLPLWIATTILTDTEMKIKLRVRLVRHWIAVAQECRNLNNFNGVMEITAGLQLTSIYRLKKTWELVNKTKSGETLQELKDLLKSTHNWKKYREVLKTCDPPCIPYLGMFLTDLTFIEDGHKDVLIENGKPLVNFIKRRQQAVVIREIQQYQQQSYHFMCVPVIRDYFMGIDQHPTDEELFKLSLQAEPRE